MSSSAHFYDMRTVFDFRFGAPLREGLAAIGRFDGRAPSLVCASAAGRRLLVHTPGAPSLRALNFDRRPTALATGPLRSGKDALFVGADEQLVALDVESGEERFCCAVEDGVHAIVCGEVLPGKDSGRELGKAVPLAVVGGHCAVHGFDECGAERLWTVTGDRVSALAIVPWNSPTNTNTNPNPNPNPNPNTSASPVLVAASDDFELRFWFGESLVARAVENARVSRLVASGAPGRFAALADSGAVAVYAQTAREWRARGRGRPVAADFCDVDGDGVSELIVGWENGRVEVRGDDAARRGALFRAAMSAPVVAVIANDYRQCGRALPVIVTADGTARGIELAGQTMAHTMTHTMTHTQAETMAHTQAEREASASEKIAAAGARGRGAFARAALRRERQALAAEFARLKEQIRRERDGAADATLPRAGTRVTARAEPNAKTGRLNIALALDAAPAGAVIQSCVLRCEAAVCFAREFAHFAADEPAAKLICAVAPPRGGAPARVHAAVVVGEANAACYQVHDIIVDIPACVMCRAGAPTRAPAGFAALQLRAHREAIAAVAPWLAQTFALPQAPKDKDKEKDKDKDERVRVEIVDERDGRGLAVEADAARGVITVRGDNMDACGDIVENLGAALQVDAAANCDFPEEMKALADVLQRVDALSATRATLSSNMADVALSLNPLLERAENARVMGDMAAMRRFYAQLYDLNRELIDENLKRSNNYAELKAALKQVNGFIMKAARLRLGKMRTNLIADCREAVRENNTKALVNLIRNGTTVA